MPSNNDEAMAAAMQEKYRLEFMQRQARKNARARATAPPSDDHGNAELAGPVPSESESIMFENDKRSSLEPNIYIPSSDQEREDAALARKLAESGEDADLRLAQQLQDEEMAYQLSQQEQAPPAVPPSTPSWISQSQTNAFRDARGSSCLEGVVEDDDMVMARQVAQEAEDADLARQYTTYEQEQAASPQQMQWMSSRQTTRQRFFGRVLPIICSVIAITVPLLFIFDVFNTENVPGLDFNWDDFDENDPFDGRDVDAVDPETAASWANSGSGLTLEVLNALEDKWQTTFQTALVNWDNGSPDALTLVTQRIDYEFDCNSVNNKLKVCNGNYGDTGWRGLNEVSITVRDGTIFASSAKMNEQYLTFANADQRLYTMCHEIGHGFGLPHWDEDFFNKDLGNCMDYTKRPQDNKTPDTSNFEFLAKLYGTKDGYVDVDVDADTTAATTSTTADTNTAGGTRNRLRRAQLADAPTNIMGDTEWLQLQPVYKQAMREFYANHEDDAQRRLEDAASADEIVYYSNSTSRLLYANDYLESHEIKLSEDIVVHVHFLLA
jgi:hypothetical protein